MKPRTLHTSLLTVAITLSFAFSASAQCETWNGQANKDELENTHIFYRDAVKAEDYAKAYPLWQKVFAAAPAADGNRATHYRDGRTIIGKLYAAETDANKQADMFDTFLKLYDQEYACYPKTKKGEDKKAALLENKAYELYYTFNHDGGEIFKIIKEAHEMQGNKLSYFVLYAYADLAVRGFSNKTLTADETVAIYNAINEICDHNASNKSLAPSYKQMQDQANALFDTVSDQLFGCEYHVKKLRPEYEANPDDKENYNRIYKILGEKGCGNTEPLMVEIYAKLKKDAAEEEARLAELKRIEKEKFEQSNPAFMAKKAYDSGDYNEAITKYQEAIDKETDTAKKAGYHFSMASIYGRKLKQYSKARSHAKTAISLDSSMGKAYMLLGDLYATGARSCGDAFEQRMAILAAVEQWSRAKSVDGSVASDASDKIARYRSHYPTSEDVFMKGKKAGDSYRVGCWIGETVTIRVK